jgi:hypothetical protein
MALTTESDVRSEAPDTKAFTAARSVAKSAKWSRLGRDGSVLWGTAIGRSDHYSVYVDVAHKEFECNCPSRKRPCKHALGLMLLEATSEASIPDAPVPSNQRVNAQQRYYDSWE